MLKDNYLFRIVSNSPGTDDRLDVDFSELGITPEIAQGMIPTLMAKETSTGAPDTMDETVSLDLTNNRLTIEEGSDGLTDGDVYVVALVAPHVQIDGVSRASA